MTWWFWMPDPRRFLRERFNPSVRGFEQAIEIRSLSEEHAIGNLTSCDPRPGDKLHLIPSHCCGTVNIYDQIYVTRNEIVEAIFANCSQTRMRFDRKLHRHSGRIAAHMGLRAQKRHLKPRKGGDQPGLDSRRSERRDLVLLSRSHDTPRNHPSDKLGSYPEDQAARLGVRPHLQTGRRKTGGAVELTLRGPNDGAVIALTRPALEAWKPARERGFPHYHSDGGCRLPLAKPPKKLDSRSYMEDESVRCQMPPETTTVQ